MQKHNFTQEQSDFIMPSLEDFGLQHERSEIREILHSLLADLELQGFDPESVSTAAIEATADFHADRCPLSMFDWTIGVARRFYEYADDWRGQMRCAQTPWRARRKSLSKKAH